MPLMSPHPIFIHQIQIQSAKMILVHPKGENNSQGYKIIYFSQYCNGNIERLRIAFFICSYRSANYCDSNCCCSFSLLKAIRFPLLSLQLEEELLQGQQSMKKNKESIQKLSKVGRAITIWGPIKKVKKILFQYYQKINNFSFGCTNIIFADSKCPVTFQCSLLQSPSALI